MNTDLISRQAAIDTAVEAADEWDGGYSRSREEIITMKLRMLPSARRKPGHWVFTGRENIYGGTQFMCSECRECIDVPPLVKENLYDFERYCRYCGAKMEADYERHDIPR